jgi:hypothetical protein
MNTTITEDADKFQALLKQVEQLKTQNKILRGFLDLQLTFFESDFNEDPGRFEFEQLKAYTSQALYLERTGVRWKNIVPEVRKQMDRLLSE